MITRYFTVFLFAIVALTACEEPDSEKEWGIALIYMPQANYDPYVVPNGGADELTNKNYSIDSTSMKLNVFLGVYRSGLKELNAYSVNVASASIRLDGAEILPESVYTLPTSVTCGDGKRDETFYLEVDLGFLSTHQETNYSLAVSISDPSDYALNTELIRTEVLINTAELFGE